MQTILILYKILKNQSEYFCLNHYFSIDINNLVSIANQIYGKDFFVCFCFVSINKKTRPADDSEGFHHFDNEKIQFLPGIQKLYYSVLWTLGTNKSAKMEGGKRKKKINQHRLWIFWKGRNSFMHCSFS